MNPPFEDYKVNLSDLVRIQNVYNSHLKKIQSIVVNIFVIFQKKLNLMIIIS